MEYKCEQCGKLSKGHEKGSYYAGQKKLCLTCFTKFCKTGTPEFNIAHHSFMQFSRSQEKGLEAMKSATKYEYAAELMKQGMSFSEATTQAEKEFGAVEYPTKGNGVNPKTDPMNPPKTAPRGAAVISEAAYIKIHMDGCAILDPVARAARIEALKSMYKALIGAAK